MFVSHHNFVGFLRSITHVGPPLGRQSKGLHRRRPNPISRGCERPKLTVGRITMPQQQILCEVTWHRFIVCLCHNFVGFLSFTTHVGTPLGRQSKGLHERRPNPISRGCERPKLMFGRIKMPQQKIHVTIHWFFCVTTLLVL
jgi:hypothetical protein